MNNIIFSLLGQMSDATLRRALNQAISRKKSVSYHESPKTVPKKTHRTFRHKSALELLHIERKLDRMNAVFE